MTQHVTAIFEHGVLKPLGPLDIRDQDVVSLSVEKMPKSGKASEESGPTLFESLQTHGLIGCVKDGPTDLSTNSKYMEGFGKSER